MFVLGRPGNDLLSRVLRHSTIGAEEFNGRVRDGIGFLAPRSNHRTGEGQRQVRPQGSILGLDPRTSLLQAQPSALQAKGQISKGLSSRSCAIREADMNHESNQANRAISTSQLNASPRLHIWPINVVVFHGSDREHSFRGGFPA